MGAEQSRVSSENLELQENEEAMAREEAAANEEKIRTTLAQARERAKLKEDFEVMVQRRMIELLREEAGHAEKGWPAVKKIFLDLYNPEREVQKLSWEADIIGKSLLIGGGAGFLWGGGIKSWSATQEFVRKYNEFTFEGKHDLRKRLTDYQIAMLGRNGINFAFKTSLMSGALCSMWLASMAYHNDVRILELSALTGMSNDHSLFHQ